MAHDPLLRLQALGQSIWLDFLRRGRISSGESWRVIGKGGLC